MLKAAVAFTGCKLNRYEVQAISESLESCGFEIVPFERSADLYVINTCGVTGKAEVSSRQLIRRARKSGPDSKVVVTGCYSDLRSHEIDNLGVDLIVSNIEKEHIRNRIVHLFDIPITESTADYPVEFGSAVISGMGDLTRGFVKIQEGCDRKCTYCTIWKSRGPVRSRRPEFIVREINRLHDNGYKEIVLTGVHIGLYSSGALNLVGLLELILAETDIPRIRLSSLNPDEVDDELVGLMSKRARICPHIHLSIQSGDDDVLKSMGRLYDRRRLVDIIGQLNLSIPKITVGADMIVGFPGESENGFKSSCDLVEETGIHHLHVFSFSARPGTAAADMDGKVSSETVKSRSIALKRIGREMKRQHMESFVGDELEVLFEKRHLPGGGVLTGLTGNYLRVRADGEDRLKGDIVKVRPFGINRDILLCDIIF